MILLILMIKKSELDNTLINSNEWRDSKAQMWALLCKRMQTTNLTPEECIITDTYVHSTLIPHVACWISADFAWKEVSAVIHSPQVTQLYQVHVCC